MRTSQRPAVGSSDWLGLANSNDDTLIWVWSAALLPYDCPLAIALLDRKHASPILVGTVISAKPRFDSYRANHVDLTDVAVRGQDSEPAACNSQCGPKVCLRK